MIGNMKKILKGQIKVECKHTFEFDLKEIEDNGNYDVDDIEALKEQLIDRLISVVVLKK